MHSVDVSWRMQKVPPSDGEAEVGDADQWLHARLVAVGIVSAKDAEILAGNMETVLYRDMESTKFNRALKAIGECLNDSPAKDRAGVIGRDDENDREHDRKAERCPN